MKKSRISIIALLLATVMLMGALAACGSKTPAETTGKPANTTTEGTNNNQTTESPSTPTESESASGNATTEKTPEETTEETTSLDLSQITENPYYDTILSANQLANGIQQYYDRVTSWAPTNGSSLIIENQQATLQFKRDKTTDDQYVEYIKNSNGATYIENTMDVYLKMRDGKTYYLSRTTNNSYTNVYKHGYYYHEVRVERLNFVSMDDERVDSLQVARIFHSYPDKIHHELQVCSSTGTAGITAIGFTTAIDASTVSKIQIRDKNGIHSSLEGIDWESVEYVAFDITEAGVFGYILPVHENTGVVTVALENGKYIITQESCPADGKIYPGNNTVLNGNDFFMGQRIYTDETHDFEAVDREAYIERNPLTAKNIKISSANSDGATLRGYDVLRGSYFIDMEYQINQLFEKRQNLHFETNFTVKGDEYDRTIYMVVTHDGGALECSVLLDENLMVLPIPVQVGKNFSGDGDDKNLFIDSDSNVSDHNLFWYADTRYSEAIFPIQATDEAAMEYSVIHLYQNWGNFPLKQISYIHFWVPYYHLSAGLVETNCIYYVGSGVDMLPDHRAKSSPYWANGAAHTSGGSHNFFQTKYKKGTNTVSLNTIDRIITSYGPTYAEIDMYMLSDDGNISAKYTHMEMPQTDENRGYYTMEYTFLKDTNFKDFKEYTSFYKVSSRDNADEYRKFGYLNENNESVIADFSTDKEKHYYTLGDYYPYFDLFYMPEYAGAGGGGYVNVSMLIKDYEVIVDGQKQDVKLVIVEKENSIYLTFDLDDVKFKAGDTITINAIIMPWGSERSDYSGEVYAPDQNVRDARENTLINPLKLTAGENCTIMDEVFMLKARSTNGVDAEFTISGGKVSDYEIPYRKAGYNATVRVYGFTTLTAPKVYEKVDGEWVEYVLSSVNTPDTLGYTNQYDGYMTHYDEDGTISYSFVINMDEAKDRTFKIVTDEEFKGFVRVETEEIVLYPYNFILEAQQVAAVGAKYPMFYNFESGEDGGMKYSSIYGTPGAEAYLVISQAEIKGVATGRYAIIKYRIPKDNPDAIPFLQIYTSSKFTDATGPDSYVIHDAFEPDGEWHVLILDTMSRKFTAASYVTANADGEVVLKYFRYDIYNSPTKKQTHWDIAYIAAHDNLEEILSANADMDYIMIATGPNSYQKVDPKTGEVIEEK